MKFKTLTMALAITAALFSCSEKKNEKSCCKENYAALANQYAKVTLTTDISHLSDNEVEMLGLLFEAGKLMVLGHLAKYNEPFNVGDVSTVISYLLADSKPNLNMGDVAILIEHLLNGE